VGVGTDTATANADAPAISIDAAATGNFLEVHHQRVSERMMQFIPIRLL